jgi:hypothetical protein
MYECPFCHVTIYTSNPDKDAVIAAHIREQHPEQAPAAKSTGKKRNED